jgi:hypothetical protein
MMMIAIQEKISAKVSTKPAAKACPEMAHSSPNMAICEAFLIGSEDLGIQNFRDQRITNYSKNIRFNR